MIGFTIQYPRTPEVRYSGDRIKAASTFSILIFQADHHLLCFLVYKIKYKETYSRNVSLFMHCYPAKRSKYAVNWACRLREWIFKHTLNKQNSSLQIRNKCAILLSNKTGDLFYKKWQRGNQEKPERWGHCEQGVNPKMPLQKNLWEGRNDADLRARIPACFVRSEASIQSIDADSPHLSERSVDLHLWSGFFCFTGNCIL